MHKIEKKQVKQHFKQCSAILLILFLLLNLLFLALSKITTSDFWLGILFVGGASLLFYKNKDLIPCTNSKQSTKTKNITPKKEKISKTKITKKPVKTQMKTKVKTTKTKIKNKK